MQASTVIMNLDKLSLSGFWNLRNPVNAVIKQAQDNCTSSRACSN